MDKPKTTAQAFNLRHLVADVMDTTDLVDPTLIAAEVYKRTPPKQRAAAYEQALRTFVRQVFSERRIHPTVTATAFSGSAKVAGIREWWQKALRDPIYVNGEAGYKALADCTRDDLLFAASERRLQADRNRSAAQRYEALATLLSENDCETVGELPRDVLMVSLGGAA